MLEFRKGLGFIVSWTKGIAQWQASIASGQMGTEVPLTVKRVMRFGNEPGKYSLSANVTGQRCNDAHGHKFTFWLTVRSCGDNPDFHYPVESDITAKVEVDLSPGHNSWMMTILDVKPKMVIREVTRPRMRITRTR